MKTKFLIKGIFVSRVTANSFCNDSMELLSNNYLCLFALWSGKQQKWKNKMYQNLFWGKKWIKFVARLISESISIRHQAYRYAYRQSLYRDTSMYRYIIPALLSGSLISWKGSNWNSSNFSNTDIDSKMYLYNRNIEAHIPVEKCSKFFKNTNSCQDDKDVSQKCVENNRTNTEYINEEINGPILWSEIEKAVCSLKNTKSCGLVEILNKHIKSSTTYPQCVIFFWNFLT